MLNRIGAGQAVDVLLLDGQFRQTLTALRAYARAGLRAAVVACASDAATAPSLRSRYCVAREVVPNFSSDRDGYVEAVSKLVEEYRPRLLLPAHDGSIQAVRARRGELERHTQIGLARESALDIATSKTRTLALATELGIRAPRSLPVNRLEDVPAVLSELGLPAVIKPYVSWVERDGLGIRWPSVPVESVDQAVRELTKLYSDGGRALVQEWLPGRREAVSLFYAHNRFWGRLAQVSYREWPVLGGASVLCETIPPAPEIVQPAEALVRAMGLEGCSMVEFRRDEEGRPALMEVNPRMGGSVALAIAAGVNFPRLLYDWKLGRPLQNMTTYQVGRRLRWLVGDIWNLKAALENQGHVDVPPRARALASFVLEFFRPGVVLDVIEVGDPRPGLLELNQVVLEHGLNRLRRLVFGSPATELLIPNPGEVN
jgi:predicted ATP-grasp superfamily ATP-dependent carboligase